MRKALFASDLIVFGYMAVVTVLVFASWSRIPDPGIYLAAHAMVAAMILMIIHAHERIGGRLWLFLRYWFLIFVIPASFREVYLLAPCVHPYDGLNYDHWLYTFDQAVFGDVATWLRAILWRPMVDLLTLCYWSYFPLALILGAALWRRNNLAGFREMMAVLVLAWYVSYLGYFIVPAIGPFQFETLMHPGVCRNPEWEGVFIGGPAHDLLMYMEARMPDAFPSGHTLIAILCIFAAWRYRVLRPVITPFGTGIVLATVYLRYHYIADVIASLILLPACWYGGLAFNRWWERRRGEQEPQKNARNV